MAFSKNQNVKKGFGKTRKATDCKRTINKKYVQNGLKGVSSVGDGKEISCNLFNSKNSKLQKDGINLDVETEDLDELDYVDDVIDDELSDIETEDSNVIEEMFIPPRSSPLTTETRVMPGTSGAITEGSNGAKSTRNQHEQIQPMSTISRKDKSQLSELTDDELASMPRVRNL